MLGVRTVRRWATVMVDLLDPGRAGRARRARPAPRPHVRDPRRQRAARGARDVVHDRTLLGRRRAAGRADGRGARLAARSPRRSRPRCCAARAPRASCSPRSSPTSAASSRRSAGPRLPVPSLAGAYRAALEWADEAGRVDRLAPSQRPRVAERGDDDRALGRRARGRRRRASRRWCGRRRRAAPAAAALARTRTRAGRARDALARLAPTWRAARSRRRRQRRERPLQPARQRGARAPRAGIEPARAAGATGARRARGTQRRPTPTAQRRRQVRRHVRRHQVGHRQRAAELQRGDEVARHALVGHRRPRARERRAARPGSRAPRWRGSPQRGQPAAQPRQRARARRAQPLPRAAPARAGHAGGAAAPGGRERARRRVSRAASVHRAGRSVMRLAGLMHGSARDRHNSVPCSCRICWDGRAGRRRAGRSRRSCCIALARYVGIYVWRWRISRAEGGRAGGAGRQARAVVHRRRCCLFVALISPIDRLGRAARLDAHGPAPADRRPRADLPDARADQAHPAPRDAPDPADRARRRARSGTRRSASSPTSARCGSGTSRRMYDAALEHGGIHVLEHLTFAAAGLLYWWHLLSPIRSRLRLGGLGPVLYMASTKILVGFLGILLAFSPTRALRLLRRPTARAGA